MSNVFAQYHIMMMRSQFFGIGQLGGPLINENVYFYDAIIIQEIFPDKYGCFVVEEQNFYMRNVYEVFHMPRMLFKLIYGQV